MLLWRNRFRRHYSWQHLLPALMCPSYVPLLVTLINSHRFVDWACYLSDMLVLLLFRHIAAFTLQVGPSAVIGILWSPWHVGRWHRALHCLLFLLPGFCHRLHSAKVKRPVRVAGPCVSAHIDHMVCDGLCLPLFFPPPHLRILYPRNLRPVILLPRCSSRIPH